MVQFHGNPSKLHHSDRFRGGRQWIERWTNAKAGFIGFLTGRGYSSDAIAEELADGTSAATVRAMQDKWELRAEGVFLTIPLTVQQRANLAARAAHRGLSLEEYCRRMLVCASMPKDRYGDLVPEDQF